MATSIRGDSGESLENVVGLVYDVICNSQNLPSEVLATALIYLKENPEVSIAYAINVGLGDWDI